MVITGRTRNAFAGQPAREFESLRLRQINLSSIMFERFSIIPKLNSRQFYDKRCKKQSKKDPYRGSAKQACEYKIPFIVSRAFGFFFELMDDNILVVFRVWLHPSI